MRWLLALALIGCGEDTPCNDAPLGGIDGICTHIDGAWRFEASDERPRCGAKLFSHPVNIRSSGSDLHGTVDAKPFAGVNYASGKFELEDPYGTFSFRGVLRDEVLTGSMVYGGPGQTCDALWDFTAHRE